MPDDARDHAETLDELGRALRDFVEAEGALTRAQQVRKRAAAQVIDRVTQLREEVSAPHAPELIGVLRHIYWQQSGISSRALASAAGLHVNEMLRAIGPCPSGILCTACQEDIPRTSRSWTPPGRYGAPLCTSCEKVEQGLASRKWCVAQLRANLIGSTPVPATARDWYAAAALVLEYPPIARGIAPGSEHDRKEGIWTGWENARRIRDGIDQRATDWDAPHTVAAAQAKELLDAALTVAGWDTARTRDVLDPITDEASHHLITRLRRALRSAVQSASQHARSAYPEDYSPNEEEVASLWTAPHVWYAHFKLP